MAGTKANKATKAVESADDYMSQGIEGLMDKIKDSKYRSAEEAIRGILHNQIEILQLLKKR